MLKRLTIYQKNSMKPIVLSFQSDESLTEEKESFEKIFSSEKIYTIETESDCLIGRPSELQAILISESLSDKQKEQHHMTENTKSKEQNDNEQEFQQSSSTGVLELNDSNIN